MKVFPVIAAMIISMSTWAQTFTKTGTTELGGSLAYSSQSVSVSGSTSSSSLSTFSFNPYVGAMVSNGFEIGIMPGYTSLSQGNSSYSIFNLFIAPAYNINTQSNVYPFIEFLLGYSSISSNSGSNSSIDGFGVGLDLGLKANISGKSLLLIQFQYLSQNYSLKNSNAFYVGTASETLSTIAFSVGYRIFLQRDSEVKK